MAGYPSGQFDVTTLTASPDVVRKGQTPAETFDLSCEFTGSGNAWQMLEWFSDFLANLNPPQERLKAETRFFLESIGPGPEMVVADQKTDLISGGSPYTVTVTGIDPDGNFLQPNGNTETIEKGIYRVQCRVDVSAGTFFTGYFSGDVLLRVA
jgi:hypothetical protein